MVDLRLRVLGDLEVIRDGEVLDLPPSRKTRGLLAYLALHECSMRREQLCELLWEVPDDPRGSLRWSLSKLRKLVDDEQHPRIIADRQTVGFDASDMDIDLCSLHEVVNNGLQDRSVEALEQAAQDYRGTFLAGLELPDFHDFYTWCIGQREQAYRAQATLLRALLQRLGEEPERAIAHAENLVALLPYDEAARVRLIELLLHLDRKAEAEQHYRLGLQKLQEVGDEDNGLLYQAWRGHTPAGNSPTSQAAPATQRFALPVTSPADHGLVGRDREIEVLTRLLEELPGATHASILLIRGNPGMGKSSLLQLAAALARGMGAGILKASAFESEQIRPFAVWNDALQRALPDNPTSKLLSSGERITRDQAFASLSERLNEQALKHPVVIFFDDVQWCDESSVSALHHVLRMNRRLPFLLVAAARETELRENAPVQQAIRSLRHDKLLLELHLEPLTEEELCTVIQRQYPDAEAVTLSRQCGGNPLLALELARAEQDGGSGHSLTELVQDRMSRISADAVEILLWAAVLAPRIDLKSLESVTGFERDLINQAIEAAERQGILHPGPRGFRFSHDLIARSIYQEISPSRRQVMHRRVAELLEEATATDLALAADLAHHAPKSGDPALATRAMISAGRMCLRFYANDDALELYQRGLEFAAALAESDRVSLTLELCDIRLNAAPLEHWEEAVEEYIGLAERALDIDDLSHARLGYQMASYVRWMHGQWSGARRDSLQAERVTRAGSDEAHIFGMAEAAKCLVLLERDLSQADAMAMEANALAQRTRVGCPALPSALGLLRYYEGRMDDAVEHLEEARTVCKAKGDKINEYLANEYLTMIEVEREDYGAAQERCCALVEMGSRLREGSEYPFALALQALCNYGQSGDDADLDDNLAAVREADAKQRLTFLLNRAATLDIRHGRLDTAGARSAEALELAELMERPSEKLLAHVNMETIAINNNALRDNSNLESIEKLSAGTVADWARARAQRLLAGRE
jgi:DNA-binding SARP family transcriptional activator/Cdc6-like AAA superfamily ATPase